MSDLDAIKARPPVWHGPQGARVLLTETERDALVGEIERLRDREEELLAALDADAFAVNVARAEGERLRNVLGSCAGFIVSIRDDHDTDEWTEDAARRLCLEIYAALHPQEPSDD